MTGTIGMRIAAAGDVPALHALVEKAYRGDTARQGWTHEADLLNDTRTSAAELAQTVADSASRVLVACADERLIGTVTITALGGALAYMSMLCVDPDLQAGGIGRRLITEAEALAARDFGARTMEMTVIDRRGELIAFYQRCGYALTGETRPFAPAVDGRFALVVLEKTIG